VTVITGGAGPLGRRGDRARRGSQEPWELRWGLLWFTPRAPHSARRAATGDVPPWLRVSVV